jgi:hypothetical protein
MIVIGSAGVGGVCLYIAVSIVGDLKPTRSLANIIRLTRLNLTVREAHHITGNNLNGTRQPTVPVRSHSETPTPVSPIAIPWSSKT